MNNEEIWKKYSENRKSIYYVSNYGNVIRKNKITEEIENIVEEKYKDSNWYIKINNVYVHRMVAEMFIPNPENKPEINHIDGNKTNNHYTNLEWCTKSENERHKYDKLNYKNSRKGIPISDELKEKIRKGCLDSNRNPELIKKRVESYKKTHERKEKERLLNPELDKKYKETLEKRISKIKRPVVFQLNDKRIEFNSVAELIKFIKEEYGLNSHTVKVLLKTNKPYYSQKKTYEKLFGLRVFYKE